MGQDLLDELSPAEPDVPAGAQDAGPNPFDGDDGALLDEAARIFEDAFTARFGGDESRDAGDQSHTRAELIPFRAIEVITPPPPPPTRSNR